MVLAAACANNDYACELVNRLGLTGFWARTAQFGLDRPLRILVVILVAAVLGGIVGLERAPFSSVQKGRIRQRSRRTTSKKKFVQTQMIGFLT